jgi:hypothetical protein
MRHHKDWIASYLSLVEGRTEAPLPYSYWSAVATVAAALTRNVWLDELRYKIYPNFLIVLAGRPGVVKKSTTIDECTNILRDVDHTLFGPSEATWQDLCYRLAHEWVRHHRVGKHEDPALDEYIPQCAMTLTLREFGTFLKPTDQPMIEGLTDLWDAGDRVYLKSTKTSGQDSIQNPFLNIIAATTAKWLRDNFSKFTGWGIASRIIFVHCEEEREPIWSPAELIRGGGLPQWQSLRSSLQDDLKEIMLLYGECHFTAEAAERAKSWYDNIFLFVSEYGKKIDADPWVCDFLARKQIHVHKLSMVLSASRRDTLQITLDDFNDAVTAVDAVEQEIRRVFSIQLTPTEMAQRENALFNYVKGELSNGLQGRVDKKQLINILATYIDGQSADRIVNLFVRRGILNEETTPRGNFILLPNFSLEGKE